jgi:hypothetical protein
LGELLHGATRLKFGTWVTLLKLKLPLPSAVASLNFWVWFGMGAVGRLKYWMLTGLKGVNLVPVPQTRGPNMPNIRFPNCEADKSTLKADAQPGSVVLMQDELVV